MLATRLLTGLLLLLLVSVLPSPLRGQISIPESVLTGRNNVQRTGVYDHESMLTPTTVASGRFRRLITRPVNGQVAAQPLYVKGVAINGVRKNALYVVTRLNYIYAFDADNTNPNDPRQGQLWANPIHLADCDPGAMPFCTRDPQRLGLDATPIKGMNTCGQTIGPVGITSTPVIDPALQRMFLVARFGAQPGTPGYGTLVYHYLVSLDVRTGQELKRVRIGDPNGSFVSYAQLNRPALLLLNNVLFVAFGAPVCDQGEDITRAHTHGWVFAYSVPDMNYLDSFNTSPDPANPLAGIWQSGAGLAADPTGNFVYAFTGNNGYTDARHPVPGLGHSILRLNLDGRNKFNGVVHFTAGNWYRLDTGFHCPEEVSNPIGCRVNAETRSWRDPVINNKPGGDSDLGSGGPVVLANGFVLGGGKQGRIYVIDGRGNFSQAQPAFQASFNTWHLGSQTTCTADNPATDPHPGCTVSPDDYDVGQAWGPNIHGSPVVWERRSKPNGFLYLLAEKDYLRAYPVMPNGHIGDRAAWTSEPVAAPTAFKDGHPPAFKDGKFRAPDGMPGGAVSVSSNGDVDGIVWVSLSPNQDATNTIEPGMLAAFNAENGNLLWYDQDYTHSFAKFVPPTIAGGKVFLATFGDTAPSTLTTLMRAGRCPTGTPADHEARGSCGSIVVYGYTPGGLRPTEVGPRTKSTPGVSRPVQTGPRPK